MNVKRLIEVLKEMPPNAEIWSIWDGAGRSRVDGIYLAQNGKVMTISKGEEVYNDEDRPINAPSRKEDAFFEPLPMDYRCVKCNNIQSKNVNCHICGEICLENDET